MWTEHLPPGFRRVFRRELRQIADRPALAFMLVPFPLLIFIMLAFVFRSGLPTDLPVAVVDLDGTLMSQQVVRMVDTTPDVNVTMRLASLSEARQALVNRKAYAAVLIPKNMERDLQLGHRPNLVVFINNQLLMIGNITKRSIVTALSTFNAGVSVSTRMTKGSDRDTAMAAANPVPVQLSPLFNPTLDYIQFLLAAVMPAVLQIFISASVALSFSRDHHTEAGMRRALRLGGSPLRLIAGKLLPYLLIWCFSLAFTDAIVFGIFGAPFNGNIWFHFLYSFMFVVSGLFLGATLSMPTKNAVASLGFVGVLTAPAFGFAGISYPRIMMDGFSKVWGSIIPLTPYLELRTDQVLRGTPISISMTTFYWQGIVMIGWGLLLLISVILACHKRPGIAAHPAAETKGGEL